MAARFPQSTTSVAYRIKPAWASKIKAIFWPADADKLHVLKSGDSATTVITRAASGAAINADGRLTGDSTTYFTFEQSGGFGGLTESGNFSFGASYYGDNFYNNGFIVGIGSLEPPDTFNNGFGLKCADGVYWNVQSGSGSNYGGATSDDVAGWMVACARHDKSDATAHIRMWLNGAEATGQRVATSGASSTDVIASTGRPLYLGGSSVGSGNTAAEFEAAWISGVLSDADMATITSDPASIIEVASSPTRLSIPTSQLTLPRSALAASSSHSFRRFG